MSFLASLVEVAVPAAVAGALLYFLNKRTAAAKPLPPVHDHEDIDPADPFTGVTMHLQVGYGDGEFPCRSRVTREAQRSRRRHHTHSCPCAIIVGLCSRASHPVRR